jgi:hypothetical protein
MNEGLANHSAMIDTTDCLEAVGVFRGWKNIFFVIVLICLLLTQTAFWLVDLGVIKPTPAAANTVAADGGGLVEPVAQAAPADANLAGAAGVAAEPSRVAGFVDKVDFEYLARTIWIINGILIVVTMLYCLTLFFGLTVSLVGRLGGINHISRAFILSVIMLVLIIPWQSVLRSSVIGVVYTPGELVQWLAVKSDSTASAIIYYLRFTGYWLIVMLLLILSQTRSSRWSNAILRRLEII